MSRRVLCPERLAVARRRLDPRRLFRPTLRCTRMADHVGCHASGKAGRIVAVRAERGGAR